MTTTAKTTTANFFNACDAWGKSLIVVMYIVMGVALSSIGLAIFTAIQQAFS